MQNLRDVPMARFAIHITGLLLILLAACGKEQVQIPVNKNQQEDIKEDFMEMNKQFVELEEAEINHYIDSTKMEMGRCISGLRYHIIEKGEGDSIVDNDKVTFQYTIAPLGGEPCESLTDVVKTITIGHTDIEKGIREAIPLLRVSGKGEFIVPAMLGYGVVGKGRCINSWTPLFMKLSIIEVERANNN